MPSRERWMPDVEPLVYFGYWCGSGWSAGHRSDAPLTESDMRVPGWPTKGSTGRSRASPVDQACKLHDTRYNQADLAKDPLKRAQIILAADRELLAIVSDLHKRNEGGKLDLNMGEVLFADNMQIAFRGKLILDGRQVAILRTERLIGPTTMNAIRTAAPASMIVLGLPTLSTPAGVPSRRKPAHAPRKAIVRFDSDATLASALASNHRGSSIDDMTKPRSDD